MPRREVSRATWLSLNEEQVRNRLGRPKKMTFLETPGKPSFISGYGLHSHLALFTLTTLET